MIARFIPCACGLWRFASGRDGALCITAGTLDGLYSSNGSSGLLLGKLFSSSFCPPFPKAGVFSESLAISMTNVLIAGGFVAPCRITRAASIVKWNVGVAGGAAPSVFRALWGAVVSVSFDLTRFRETLKLSGLRLKLIALSELKRLAFKSDDSTARALGIFLSTSVDNLQLSARHITIIDR